MCISFYSSIFSNRPNVMITCAASRRAYKRSDIRSRNSTKNTHLWSLAGGCCCCCCCLWALALGASERDPNRFVLNPWSAIQDKRDSLFRLLTKWWKVGIHKLLNRFKNYEIPGFILAELQGITTSKKKIRVRKSTCWDCLGALSNALRCGGCSCESWCRNLHRVPKRQLHDK